MERYSNFPAQSRWGPAGERWSFRGMAAQSMELLGFSSPLKAERLDAERIRLTGQLDSVMGKIELRAELSSRCGAFDSMVHTGKGDMRLTGSRADGTE